MFKPIAAALVLALAVAASPTSAPVASPSPAGSLTTLPPEIGHVHSRPFCSALATHIAPAIAHLLATDAIVKHGPPLFEDYNFYNGSKSNAGKEMTLERMENLVTPMVDNIGAVEDALHDPVVFRDPPRNADDKRLLAMRAQLEEALAMQNASLDIINGFVTTQQLGDLQHAGMGLLKNINRTDQARTPTAATPNPQLQDPNAPGLPADPYFIDPAAIPGLTLGYNPVTRLNAGLKWTQKQARAKENVAAKSVIVAARLCGGHAPGEPSVRPTPTP